MSEVTCSVEDCPRPVDRRQAARMCESHYRTEIRENRSPCKAPDCETRSEIAGWCQKHYHRVRRHGVPDDPTPARTLGPCSIDGCDKTERSRGLCNMHLQRWVPHGHDERTAKV